MLTVFGKKQNFCDGLSRRNFLKIGAFGAGLTLADMLRLRAAASNAPGGATSTAQKAAIMIYLPGGPPHMDMWDLKPNAPQEYRGEFNPIATNVPGLQICEHFPMQARMFDKLAVIRSIRTVDEHSDSMVMTGLSQNANMTANHPSFGSVVSRMTSESSSVPPFVTLRGMSRGAEPGFLGVAHRAFQPSGPGLQNLSWANGVNMAQVEERQNLLNAFDGIRRDIDASGTMEGMDSFTSRAFEMVSSGAVRQALDLDREPPQTRARYQGLNQFLQARRLVEAGVGCVTLAYGGWDTHSNNFQTCRNQLPVLDRGIANLVQDLCERGMDQDVSVVVWGEFGRTPRVNGSAGRDHWAPVMSALIAGGGMSMGQAIGASSSRGEQPAERPLSPQRVLATLYRTMGIDPAMTFLDGTGRPRHIVEDREPIPELYS